MNPRLLRRTILFLTLFFLLVVLLAGCSPNPATAVQPTTPIQASDSSTYWPTKGWRTSTPAEQGMDAQKLAQMLEVVQKKNLALHSLLVVRNGYLVSETYFKSYKADTQHESYSCTKSFISTLIGIAIDKGYLKGTDQRIVDFFPERTFENFDAQKQAITLDDVLTMRSGLDWKETDQAIGAMYQSRDWVKHVLDMPMAEAPGTRFNYCSGCSHVLSAILKQATGMSPRDFAGQYLFEPLGISNVRWDIDSQGIPIGGWGLQITPRDMAKLGYLYLYEGQWDGQQIVSAGWVQTATQTHADAEGVLDYGYQWWVYPSLRAYTALGMEGQTIFVVPGEDLVIVTTAQMENHDVIFKLIEGFILPSVQDSP
jgi:CubicO group peptidase (beta-lactamase class C family)